MENIDYEGLVKALKARRFLPEVFDTAAEAKAAALEIIGTKSVGIGGSATVRDMGLAEALQANGNEVYWHWLAAMDRIKRDACPTNARRLGLDTPCARTGQCHDCRTAARMCNVTFILEAPTRPVKAFHVLIVKEDLGL